MKILIIVSTQSLGVYYYHLLLSYYYYQVRNLNCLACVALKFIAIFSLIILSVCVWGFSFRLMKNRKKCTTLEDLLKGLSIQPIWVVVILILVMFCIFSIQPIQIKWDFLNKQLPYFST